MTHHATVDHDPDAKPAAVSAKRRRRRWLGYMLCCGVAAWALRVALTTPTNDRDWTKDQDRLAVIELDAHGLLKIHNVRNASYRSASDYDVHWEARQYDLNKIESVWYVVEPFADWRGPAHTFLSFGFSDGRYLSVSAEIRKERGETFSPWLGLVRSYELIYVFGDERDLIGLRANMRHDEVYLYPLRARKAQARALLEQILSRAAQLAAAPEFYNTLTNSCTSNIIDHVEHLWPGRIPFSYRALLPGLSDDLAYELGLVDTEFSFAEYRRHYLINEAAWQFRDDPLFSTRIRDHLPPRSAAP